MVIDEAILKRAIKIFGYKRQINKAHEECLELALAITQYLKKPSDKGLEEVIDETADVIIMTKQLEIMLPGKELQARIDFKLNRLDKNLNNLEI